VRVVTRLGLVLDVRRVDCDAARLLLGRVVDLLEALDGRRAADVLREHLGDRRGQRRLAVVDVTDGADVEMRLRALELLLCHASPLGSYASAATISVAIDCGTSSYLSNCIVNSARPCVIERRSVAYPNISARGTLARITCALPTGSRFSTRPRREFRLPMTSPR